MSDVVVRTPATAILWMVQQRLAFAIGLLDFSKCAITPLPQQLDSDVLLYMLGGRKQQVKQEIETECTVCGCFAQFRHGERVCWCDVCVKGCNRASALDCVDCSLRRLQPFTVVEQLLICDCFEATSSDVHECSYTECYGYNV